MYLKALEVNGFKSFAEKIKIEFTKGITSVVGPNGSGKSNILDAILWVLGEQSYKNIRAKKSQDVIFSGGKNKKEKSFAEVSLFIDNSDGTLQSEAKEIKVTRYINKNGENFYFINDEKSRLKDIQELFMDTGVGKSAYSVIGQGKVERIVSSSSQEIRSIIEEAAGIKKIKLRKTEAENKLGKVELEIEKISYVEKELYENYKNISKQAEKALKYKELKMESEKLKKAIFFKEKFEKTEEFENISEKYKNIEELNENSQNEFVLKEETLEKTLEERNSINEKYDQLNLKNKELEKDLEILGNNRIRLIERIKNLDKEISEKNNDILYLIEKKEQREKKIEELATKETELNSFIDNEELSNEETNNFLREKELAYETLENKLQSTREKVLDIEVERVKFLNDIEEADRKENTFSKKIKQLEDEIKEKQLEKSEVEKLYKLLEKEKESLEIEKKVTDDDFIDTQNKQKNNELILRETLKSKDELEYTLRNKTLKFDNLKKIDESNEGFFKGVKLIINEKVNGVYGPVLSLIEIPEKFMTAIESALGNSLQDIVVDSGETAKKCMTLLREKNGGRASFIPLDLIKPQSILFNVRQSDGIYGIASNLIKYDSNIKKAIDFVFDGILVVENMNKALEVQKNGSFRGRIVTLEGDILATNGRMTGGEQAKSASNLIFERKKEIKKLEDEIKELNISYESKSKIYFEKNTSNNELLSKLDKLKEKKEEIFNRLEEKKREYNEKSFAYNVATKVLETLEFEKLEVEESIDEFIIKREKANISIKELERKLEDIKNLIVQLDEEKSNAKEFLEKYRNENSDKRMLYATKLEERKQLFALLENFANELKDTEEEILKAKKIIESAREEKTDSEEKSELLLLEIEEKREINKADTLELEALNSKIKELDLLEKKLIVEIKNIETEIVKQENLLNNTREKMDKLKYSIEDFEEKLASLEQVELVELKEDLINAKKNLKVFESRIQALGYVNLLAVEEYESAKEKYEFLYNQKNDLVESKKNLITLIKEIEDVIKASFREAYEEINKNFNYMCKEILNNSIGSLQIQDEDNLLESGVELMVKFKNKKYQSLSLLSGGEKSMVAVALIMAIFMYKPSPFTFFDEIEAALDESNTKRLLKKLKEFTDKSQFILITHNKHTMKESDQLYGVTMNKEIGESKILSVIL
ncbi:MAG: chromosome segregation protein SMC [Fusobacteriaceae bacterium]|nr:chromosome segregation protein SMC [Fusobacteriaceae bacterium]